MDITKKPHPYPGRLLVFEGFDGCGKGTQLDLVKSLVSAAGYSDRVLFVKSPGGTALGEAIRHILFRDIGVTGLDHDAASLLYLASAMQLVTEVVVPALKQGKLVISDRWETMSSVVYGRVGLAEPVSEAMERARGCFTLRPNRALLFYGNAKEFLDRAMARGGHQPLKAWNEACHAERIQDEYLRLFLHAPGVHAVDVTGRSPESIFVRDVWCHVAEFVEDITSNGTQ